MSLRAFRAGYHLENKEVITDRFMIGQKWDLTKRTIQCAKELINKGIDPYAWAAYRVPQTTYYGKVSITAQYARTFGGAKVINNDKNLDNFLSGRVDWKAYGSKSNTEAEILHNKNAQRFISDCVSKQITQSQALSLANKHFSCQYVEDLLGKAELEANQFEQEIAHKINSGMWVWD